MATEVNKKKIAKNTIHIYIRTIGIVLLMLYASRVVLQNLGVDDYGTYNLVGSIVAMFTSLRVVFTSATQRFLNYEKGQGDILRQSVIFKASRRLHLWMSIIFFIIVEITGILMIKYQLNIPVEKLNDAYILLQCSVASTIIMILTVPYNAVIVANEKFEAFTYISILEYSLQLGAAFLIAIIPSNKLIWYGVLILIIALIVRVINWGYCYSRFEECRIKCKIEKSIYKEIGIFAGWNFLGNFALSIYNEGINIILNLYGGVIANAARAICQNVYRGLASISENALTAFAPQATQQYAIKEFQRFYDLIYSSTRIISSLYIIVAIPIFIHTPLVLEIWLGEIPEYTVSFVRAILLYGYTRVFHSPLDLCFKCYGDLKQYQIIEVCCLIPSLPLAYYMLKYEMDYYWVFIAMSIGNVINNIAIAILAKKKIDFKIWEFTTKTIVPNFIIVVASIPLCLYINKIVPNIIIQILINITIVLVLILSIALSKAERLKLKSMLPC